MSKSRGTFIMARTYLDHLNPEYLRYYFAAKLTGKAGAKSSSANQSPGEGATKSRGGLSCLRPPATLDEDTAPLVKSPERKQIMSPSGKSISDIFGKVKLLFCVHWGESLSYKSIL